MMNPNDTTTGTGNIDLTPLDGDVGPALGAGNAASVNDNANPHATPDTTALAADPSVAAVIRGTLVRNGRHGDKLVDDVPEVLTRALEAARRSRMPASLDEWKALGATIAERYAIDENRAAKVRERYDAGLCEDPDEHGPLVRASARDPVDTARYLGILKKQFEAGDMPHKGEEILLGVADGLSYKEIAAETGISERQARYRMERMRGKFAAELAKLGMLVILVLVAAPFAARIGGAANDGPAWWSGGGGGRVTAAERDAGARSGDVVPLVTREQQARRLREEGIAACERGEWEMCVEKLDQARELDPTGDAAPEVQAAREWATDRAPREKVPASAR